LSEGRSQSKKRKGKDGNLTTARATGRRPSGKRDKYRGINRIFKPGIGATLRATFKKSGILIYGKSDRTLRAEEAWRRHRGAPLSDVKRRAESETEMEPRITKNAAISKRRAQMAIEGAMKAGEQYCKKAIGGVLKRNPGKEKNLLKREKRPRNPPRKNRVGARDEAP